MIRYQVVYGKRGEPLIAWYPELAAACKMAVGFRKVGYIASVWEHTDEGVRELSDSEIQKGAVL